MIKHILLRFLTASIVLLFVTGTVMAQSAPVVKEIEINGLRKIEESAVLSRISHRTGEPLDYDMTSSDIKDIFSMGYFENVQVEVEPFEGGVKLIYNINEKPSVLVVDIQGNQNVSDDKLREAVTISPGAIADTVLINENALKLKTVYESEGYPLANIIPVLNVQAEGEIRLTYLVQEGPKVKIKKITITGNDKISDRRIKNAMDIRERHFYSLILSKGYFSRSLLNSDVEKIKDLYLDNGYVKVTVDEPRIEFSPDRKWLNVTINVNEGEQHSLSSISYSGNKAVSEEELKKATKSETGKPISRKSLQKDVAAMTELYTDRGYAVAAIYPALEPREGKKEVDVIFQVDEGNIYTIGRIEISGNVRTRDKVIRREMLLDEGDTFSSTKLKKSYERITNLNFFDSVKMQPAPRVEEKKLDINVDVKERPTGFINVGGGYSSIDKLIFMVDITQGNLGGRGQYLKLKGELGGSSSFYELSFRDPWFLNRPIQFSASIYNRNREYIEYDRESTGFELGFGRRFWLNWRANVEYNLEKATITNISEDASVVIKEQEGDRITSSISPSITRDTRDNYIITHTGSKNSLQLTYAGIGGDNKFIKGIIDSSWYLPIGPTTLSLRGRFGYASGTSGERLPLYERFYVGGIGTIRGLGFGEGGPRDENGTVIGGEKELLFNIDYMFPIVQDLNFYGVGFFDAGSAFNDEFEELRYTAGAGIRWISPVGPLRLEWGYNIEPKHGEDDSRWEFTFGSFF